MRVPGATLELDAADARVGAAVLLGSAGALAVAPEAHLVCPLYALTGVPCPLCGLTTSVEATVTLRLDDALAVNPAGAVLVAAAMAVVVRRRAPRVPATLVAVALIASWLFQLVRFGVIS